MTARSLRPSPVHVVLLGLFLSSSGLVANTPPPPTTPESVYVVSGSDQILVADFATGKASEVICQSGAQFRGLVVRNDLRLVVADQSGGGRIRLYDTQGNGAIVSSAIPAPGGVAQNLEGDIYVTTSKDGCAAQVWRLPRRVDCPEGDDPFTCPGKGYEAAVRIDSEVRINGAPVERLADVKFVPFSAAQPFSGTKKLTAGDLLVLVQDPPALLRYSNPDQCTGSCEPDVVVPPAAFGCPDPTAVAFSDLGTILVATKQGRILRFGSNGQILPDFAQVQGVATAISVGIQGSARAFVSVAPKSLVRFSFAADGTGVLAPKVVGGLKNPAGVNLATGSATPTPLGAGRVALSAMTADWEQVTQPGLSNLYCINFTDPRESEPEADGLPLDAPLHRALSLSEPGLPQALLDLGFPNTIPPYIRSFRRLRAGDAPGHPTGPHTFRVCQAKTTATFKGLVQNISDENPWLGYEPGCSNAQDGLPHHDTPELFMQSRFAYSEEPPEDPLYEGRVFIDNTTICNNDGTRAWKFGSLYMPSVRDTRPLDGPGKVAENAGCTAEDGIVDCKLNNLSAVLDSFSCIKPPTRNKLKNTLRKAIQKYDGNDHSGHNANCHVQHPPNYCGARKDLRAFLNQIAKCPGDFGTCSATASAELRSRTESAIYMLSIPELCPIP